MKDIVLAFDKLIDCEYNHGEFSFWGYDSRSELNVQKISFSLGADDSAALRCKWGECLKFGKIFPLNEQYIHTYCSQYGFILELKSPFVLQIRKYSKKLHIANELRLLSEYLKIHSKYEIFGIVFRVMYWAFFSKSKLNKKTVILCDLRDRAGDNAEALFRYFYKEHIEEYDCYFALKRTSCDWNRMSQYGKVIDFNSIKYMKLYWAGALIVSSQADIPVWMPLGGKGYDTYKDIGIKRKIVFLQHGVIKDDLSGLYNAEKTPCSIFVTTTMPEYRSLLERRYGYVEGQIKMTGLPRYDLLRDEPEKILTVIPTWRVTLQGVSKNEFESSEFYQIQRKLLMEPEFADLAEKYGYEIHLMQHPMMESVKHYFEGKFDCRIRVLPYNTSYSDIFARSSVIVTDYSSVAFDFAYLRKPVLYYQEDRESFFSGTHNYVKGYYDYERDGFGEVLLTKEAFLSTVESYMKTDCKPKAKYLDRINATFSYNDRRNCERVYEEIKKIY